MDSLTMEWYSWDRIKLRMLKVSQHDSFIERAKDIIFRYLSSNTKVFIHRLALLTWILELDLAKKLWEEKKGKHAFYGFPKTFEEFLFRVLICEKIGPGPVYHYPEFHNVNYLLFDEEDAFKLSTIPLSELLKMHKPHFSSADGLINVDFDKRELGRIAKMVPERHHDKLRLPLILLRKMPLSYDEYMTVGTKLENMLLQKLLKITETPFEKDAEIKEKSDLTNISMLRRRRFKTVYKILPEFSTIWLKKTHQRS